MSISPTLLPAHSHCESIFGSAYPGPFKAISEKRNMNKIYVSWNPPSIPVRKYTVTVTDNTNDKSLNYNIAGSASIRLKFKYFFETFCCGYRITNIGVKNVELNLIKCSIYLSWPKLYHSSQSSVSQSTQ